MEHDRTLDSVVSWAKRNWKLIEPMMIAVQKEHEEARHSSVTVNEQESLYNAQRGMYGLRGNHFRGRYGNRPL